jgi:hypothetical protein
MLLSWAVISNRREASGSDETQSQLQARSISQATKTTIRAATQSHRNLLTKKEMTLNLNRADILQEAISIGSDRSAIRTDKLDDLDLYVLDQRRSVLNQNRRYLEQIDD